MPKLPKNVSSTSESAKSNMTRRKFLGALATVGVAPLLAANFSLKPNHFKKLSQIDIETTDQVMGRMCLIQTHDGGYFLSYQCMSNMGLYKFSAEGKQEWSQILALAPRIKSAFQARDGSLFVLGKKSTPALASAVWGVPQDTPAKETSRYPFLLHMDASGRELPFRVRAPYKTFRGTTIQNMMEAEDGFIFFGSKTATLSEIPGKPLGEWRDVKAPWIFKLDASMRLVWEFNLTSDSNEYVYLKLGQDIDRQPILDEEENLVLSIFVYDLVIIDGVYDTGYTRENHSRLVVMKLDKNGKEIARNSFPNSDTFLLAPIESGYVLAIENKLVTLDHDLVMRSELEIRNQGNFSPFSALPSSREGSFTLFGIESSPSSDVPSAALASMDEKGYINILKTFGRGSGYGDMAPGRTLDEVAILYLPSSGFGIFTGIASSGVALSHYQIK